MNVYKMPSHWCRIRWYHSHTILLLHVPRAVADTGHCTAPLHSPTALLGHLAQEYLSTFPIILAEPAVAVGTSASSDL